MLNLKTYATEQTKKFFGGVLAVLISLVIAVTIVYLGLSAAPILLVAVYERMYTTQTEYVSPANVGSVVFYKEEGFLDTTINLHVRDYEYSGSKDIDLGKVSDFGGQGIPPDHACWSGDGTVIVLQKDKKWIKAYDFLTHSEVLLPWEGGSSNPVDTLFKVRGGKGKAIF